MIYKLPENPTVDPEHCSQSTDGDSKESIQYFSHITFSSLAPC